MLTKGLREHSLHYQDKDMYYYSAKYRNVILQSWLSRSYKERSNVAVVTRSLLRSTQHKMP